MKNQNIKINKNEYLKKSIPSNCIFFKNLTGIGATHIELNIAQRNSIIIEPFVPVIIGKSNDKENILGVYESVTKQAIVQFLSKILNLRK